MKELEITLQIPGKHKIYYVFGEMSEVEEWLQKKAETSKKNKGEWENKKKSFHNRYSKRESSGSASTVINGNLVWINTKKCKTIQKKLLTCVHENRHIADKIADRYGFKDSEYFAYLESFLYNELSNFLYGKKT